MLMREITLAKLRFIMRQWLVKLKLLNISSLKGLMLMRELVTVGPYFAQWIRHFIWKYSNSLGVLVVYGSNVCIAVYQHLWILHTEVFSVLNIVRRTGKIKVMLDDGGILCVPITTWITKRAIFTAQRKTSIREIQSACTTMIGGTAIITPTEVLTKK
jgi:hypothetical protein